MDYYPEYDAFYLHTGIAAQAGASALMQISGLWGIYIAGISPKYVYEFSGATDNSTPISAYLETKREAYGNSNILKRGRIINLTSNMASTETVSYKCYVDNETSIATKNAWSLSVGSGITDSLIGFNRTHWKVKHRIEESSGHQTFFRQLQHDGYVVRSR